MAQTLPTDGYRRVPQEPAWKGPPVPVAHALIIGNEILAGRFQDENGPYLITRLREIGLDLRRMLILPDDVSSIAEEVRRSSPTADWVFTSGGLGPTHDDVTMQGVAKGLGLPLHTHADLLARVESMVQPFQGTARRMVEVPRGTTLWDEGEIAWPVLACRNVIAFPGPPTLFRRKFEAVAHRLDGEPLATCLLRFDGRETAIADPLNEATERFPEVGIGSYPKGDGDFRWVLVSLESRDREALALCQGWLEGKIPTLIEE